MIINAWQLVQDKMFTEQLNKLIAEIVKLQQTQPESFKEHPKTKKLARIYKLMLEEIPADPAHAQWNQGNTLGEDFRFWKRAKFGPNHFRLFFRYDGSRQVIIYAWMNDEKTLRKDGDKNDPYAIFAKGLRNGDPPSDLNDLLKR
ncbi:MAG: type II toxin-antitoxin system YhaV family toxin [Cyanobacteria bacterium REEB67]|nr:type II toxin-antitoxin system YhaV family toxin [Cyanobacteria bacterium REEB67]